MTLKCGWRTPFHVLRRGLAWLRAGICAGAHIAMGGTHETYEELVRTLATELGTLPQFQCRCSQYPQLVDEDGNEIDGDGPSGGGF